MFTSIIAIHKILLPTTQFLGNHTIIRNAKTSRDEFIFYSKKMMRLLTEFTLSLLGFNDVVVETLQFIIRLLSSS